MSQAHSEIILRENEDEIEIECSVLDSKKRLKEKSQMRLRFYFENTVIALFSSSKVF